MEFEYTGYLSRVASLMERGDQVSADVVEEELGNDISAHRSVPTAIYSFLRASNSIPNIEVHYMISYYEFTELYHWINAWMHFDIVVLICLYILLQ